jgi:iron complex outermembrane receptor protein
MAASYRPSTSVACAVSEILHALAICTPAAFVGASAALAQAPEAPVLKAPIAAQPLAEALAEFASQTGLQLLYVSGVVLDQRSTAVPAGLTPGDALTRLLKGTGLRFEYLTAHSIRVLGIPPPRPAAAVGADLGPQEVIVTANRRVESLQNVPITVEVLTHAELDKLNATTFDDFVGNLPGMTDHGVGPGQNNIYVRGLATIEPGPQSVVLGGTFPNVAVYLDEQSVQFPSHNLDVYTADLERIELLEGPQGTLFGAGAQAGVLRYITNKPKLNVTEGRFDTGYAWTTNGAPSYSLSGVFNLPLIADTLAVRAVVYDEKRGGYIDNPAATFARANSDAGIHYAYADNKVPANSVTINNSAIAGRDINPVTFTGARLESLYQINDTWDALLSLSYQSIYAQGVFAEMAANSLGQPQPDLTVQLFNPAYYKDNFRDAALTIDGQIGALKFLYTGGYLTRNIEQVQDYTQYARGAYADFYQCVNPSLATSHFTTAAAQCFTPSSTWHNTDRNTHQNHELRLTSPSDWRLRGIGGLFYENYQIHDQTDWFYLSAIPYFNPIAPPTGYYTLNGKVVCTCQPEPGDVFHPESPAATLNNPNVRPPGDADFNDLTRSYTQTAAYASLDFDLIPRALTLTAGTRYFRIHDSIVGASVGSFGCQLIFNPQAPNPCVNLDTADINAEGLHPTYSEFTSRLNLTWKLAEDALLYYTWSQGFRPGSFNRPVATPSNSPLSKSPPGQDNPWQAQANEHGGWQPPWTIAPDSLINNEVGWKTSWFAQTLQWDGAVYQENWSHVQVPVTAVGIVPPDIINGGDYQVRGLETSLLARITDGLTMEAGSAWNHGKLTKEAPLSWADGTLIDFSELRTSNNDKIVNPAGTLGSPLAGAPQFQGHLRVHYEYPLNSYIAFAQLGAMHQSQSLASTDQLSTDFQGQTIAYVLPGFTTYDGAVGVRRDSWIAQVYGVNLSDTRAQLYANYRQYYKAVTVSRPRTIGLRVSYAF